MPSPPASHGKGYKSSDPFRQFNFNQQRSNRSYQQQQQSPMIPYENNARRYRQQDYYNFNRRQTYAPEWNRAPTQRYSRNVQGYDNNRFYPQRRESSVDFFCSNSNDSI